MVPAVVMAIPVLILFQTIHLKDTVAALVIVNVAFWTPLVAWLLRNVFEDVPVAIERAARMDGCSRLGTLFRVTLPAARPAIAAIAILVHHRHLERVPVRDDPGRPQHGDPDALDLVHRVVHDGRPDADAAVSTCLPRARS